MCTLIVDSYVEIINRLKDLLSESENSGTIYTATSFNDASEILRNIKPEIVVLDLNLPQNLSYELLKQIRKLNSGILVIILSIHIDAHIKAQCIELGADHFFDKYNEFDKITDVIDLKRPIKTV